MDLEQHHCHQPSALRGLDRKRIWHSQRGCHRCGHAASCQNKNSVNKSDEGAEKEAHHPPIYQYVPHQAVAEVSKIASYRRLVAVKHGPQSKSTDGSKSGSRQRGVVVVVMVVAM